MASQKDKKPFFITKEVIGICNQKNLSIENIYFLLSLYSEDIKDLILNFYFLGKSNVIKKTLYYSLINKLLVRTKERKEEFDYDNYELTDEGREICEKLLNSSYEKKIKVDTLFVEEFIECFPSGVRNGGFRYLRGDRYAVESNLISFLNKHKNYDKELILKATRNFIRKFNGDYTYCPTAPYFISKGKTSTLAEECENLLNLKNKPSQTDSQWM